MKSIDDINGKKLYEFPIVFVIAFDPEEEMWGFNAISNSKHHDDFGFCNLVTCNIEGFGFLDDHGPFDSPEEALKAAIEAVRNAGNERVALLQEATRLNQADIAAILGDGK